MVADIVDMEPFTNDFFRTIIGVQVETPKKLQHLNAVVITKLYGTQF